MDNKVLDEAVEVALRASDEAAEQQDFSASEDDGLSEAKAVMRAALLASLPVLLGEPVAWAHALDVDAVADADMEIGNVLRLFPTDRGDMPRVALYAPSLGEGDGR